MCRWIFSFVFALSSFGSLFGQESVLVSPAPVPVQRVVRLSLPEMWVTEDAVGTYFRARVEVALLGGTEGMMYVRSLQEAAKLAADAGEGFLAVELEKLAKIEPALILPVELNGESQNAAVLRGYAAGLRRKAAEKDANAEKRLRTAKLLDRAANFAVRLGRTRADLCWITTRFCEYHVRPDCSVICDVLAAERMSESVCSHHGLLAAEWIPSLALPQADWSPELANQLGGVNDQDVLAATAWLSLMKPYFLKSEGEEWVKKVYECEHRRTRLWLIAARTLRCNAASFYGARPVLTEQQLKKLIDEQSKAALKNQQALEIFFARLAVNCSPCGEQTKPCPVCFELGGGASGPAIVIPESAPLPGPELLPAPSPAPALPKVK